MVDLAQPGFEACVFSSNGRNGVTVRESSLASFYECVMQSNSWSGAFFIEAGHGDVKECRFSKNGEDGVSVDEDGNALLNACTLVDNQEYGLDIEGGTGRGIVDECLFRGNGIGAWRFEDGSEGNVILRNNTEE